MFKVEGQRDIHMFKVEGQRDIHMATQYKTFRSTAAPPPRKKVGCKQCDKTFENKEQRKKHMKEHSIGFPCPVCPQVFSSTLDRTKHKYAEHQRSRREQYPCLTCGANFGSINLLAIHSVTHNKEVIVYPCDMCEMKFEQLDTLMLHRQSDHQEDPMRLNSCNLCDQTFETVELFNGHMTSHSIKTTSIPKPEEKKRKCPTCSELFSNVFELEKHRVQVHGLKATIITTKCSQCYEEFPTQGEMFVHRKTKHPMLPTNFRCEICDDYFHTERSLKVHLRLHNKGTPNSSRDYPCDLCKESFSRIRELMDHKVLNHIEAISANKKVAEENRKAKEMLKTHVKILPKGDNSALLPKASNVLGREELLSAWETDPNTKEVTITEGSEYIEEEVDMEVIVTKNQGFFTFSPKYPDKYLLNRSNTTAAPAVPNQQFGALELIPVGPASGKRLAGSGNLTTIGQPPRPTTSVGNQVPFVIPCFPIPSVNNQQPVNTPRILVRFASKPVVFPPTGQISNATVNTSQVTTPVFVNPNSTAASPVKSQFPTCVAGNSQPADLAISGESTTPSAAVIIGRTQSAIGASFKKAPIEEVDILDDDGDAQMDSVPSAVDTPRPARMMTLAVEEAGPVSVDLDNIDNAIEYLQKLKAQRQSK